MAQERAWQPAGPFGSTVSEIAIHPTDPSIFLVGTIGAGVFRSTDGSASWERASAGLPTDVLVFDIEFSRSQPNIVFMSTYSGIFKSTDAGQSWADISEGGLGGTVPTIAVSPTDPNIVLANTGFGMWRSTDGGTSWTHQEEPVPSDELVFVDATLVYSGGSHVSISNDAGITWTDNDHSPIDHASAIVTDPSDADVVYAGDPDGIWRSDDGAWTWRLVWDSPALERVRDMAIAGGGNIYAALGSGRGVIKSSDGGVSWSTHGDLPEAAVLDVATSGNAVFAGLSNRGFFEFTGSWEERNEGLTGSMPRSLDFAPNDARVVFAGVVGQGIYRSRDGGRKWKLVKRLPEHIFSISATNTRRIWAGAQSGLYRSFDGGKTWRRIRKGLPKSSIMAVEAPRRQLVYAGTYSQGTFFSRDGGRTWNRGEMGGAFVTAISALRSSPRHVVVNSQRGTHVSFDGAKTWSEPADPFGSDIEIAPSNPKVVYAGALGSIGILRSNNGGRTFEPLVGGGAPDRVYALAIDPEDAKHVFAGSYSDGEFDTGIFESTDGGKTWRARNDGLTSTWIISLAINRSGTRLIAGTTAYGVESGAGAFVLRLR